jgi:hypothetical protein
MGKVEQPRECLILETKEHNCPTTLTISWQKLMGPETREGNQQTCLSFLSYRQVEAVIEEGENGKGIF